MSASATPILYLNPDPRRYAGSNVSLLSLVTGLDRRFRPIVATPADGDMGRMLSARQVETLDYRMNNWWYPDRAHFDRTAAGLRARVEQLAEVIRTERVGLVHSNAEYAFEGALAAAMTGVPHVWNIRQMFGADLDILRFFPLSATALGQFMADFSDVIVPNVHPLIATFPAVIPRDKFRVVHSGIRLEEPMDRAAARAALRARLGLPDDAGIVLSMGRISPEKGLESFIETARRVIGEHRRDDLHFVHFGPVHCEAHFAALQQSCADLDGLVRFAGPVDTPLQVLRGADLFLFTSTVFEGLARACAEALLMETPVISTRCLGPEEYLLHGETALLADQHDSATLAAHVLRLRGDPEQARTLAQRGGRLVRERYGEDRVNAEWAALYAQTLDGGRRCTGDCLAAELAIGLITRFGQLGEQQHSHEMRLRKLEDIARMLSAPVTLLRRLAGRNGNGNGNAND